MKRSLVCLLLALSLVMVFCAGCSSNNTTLAEGSATMAPTATPAPTEEPVEETAEPEETEEPEETAEPEEEEAEESEEEAQQTTTTSNNNTTTTTTTTNTTNNTTNNTTAAAEATPQQDKKSVAEDMVGQDVSSLYAAIGSPNGSDYTASCLVLDGEDGMLYYGSFTVSTVRYSNGTELVMGVY
jgi:cytoskeletal protein RodZ